MEFADVLKAYLEVGCLGLAAVILFTLFILVVKKLITKTDKTDSFNQNQLSELMSSLTNQNSLLLKDILDSNKQMIEDMTHKVINHVPSAEETKQLTLIQEQIDDVLKEILIKTNASRADLVQYHNGVKNLNKQSFLKMSMTNEQVNIGVTPFIGQFKEQFRGVLSYFNKQLNEYGKCYIPDSEQMKTVDTSMYEFLVSRKIQAKFGMAIYGKDGQLIAFVCVEFEDKTKVDLKHIDSILTEKQDTIQTLLNIISSN